MFCFFRHRAGHDLYLLVAFPVLGIGLESAAPLTLCGNPSVLSGICGHRRAAWVHGLQSAREGYVGSASPQAIEPSARAVISAAECVPRSQASSPKSPKSVISRMSSASAAALTCFMMSVEVRTGMFVPLLQRMSRQPAAHDILGACKQPQLKPWH